MPSIIRGKDYPMEECAKDMEAGLNAFGDTGDKMLDDLLAKGGVTYLNCPACIAEGREPHSLHVQKRDGRFYVTALERTEWTMPKPI